MTAVTDAVNELSLASTKQLRKWFAYLRAHQLMPSTASTFASQDTPTAFLCLRLDRLEGIRIPRQIIERIGSSSVLQICVRVSFFHETTRQFFGRTVATAPIAFSASSDGTLALNAPLYFQTRICDPTAFAVAEPVVNILEPIDGVIIESITLGFATLNIFARSASSLPGLTAMSSSRSRSSTSGPSSTLYRPIFQGSTRALAVIDPATNWKDRLRATQARLVYDLFDASSLRDAVSHLLQDNEIITTQSIVAGLPQRAIATVLSPPPSAILHISSPKVAIPEELEPRALRSLNSVRQRADGCVVNRRLIFGIHNGRRFIHSPVGLELLPAPRDHPFNYLFEGTTTLSVNASFDDPLIVLVIELLLEIEWRVDNHQVPERAEICAGWIARSIYSPELPATDTRLSMMLISCPGRSPSNAMTLAFNDISVCMEIGIQDPNLNAMKLPRLLITEKQQDIKIAEDKENVERIRQEEQSSPSPKATSPRMKSPSTSFHRLSTAPAAITIDGALLNYDISPELEMNDPLKAARYEIVLQWIESVGSRPFTSLVFAMHVFGEKAFISNSIELASVNDFIAERSPIRQHLSITHSIYISCLDHDAFIARICQRYVEIEVWDPRSQLLIGRARINLRHSLRQRQPSIEVHLTADIEDVKDNVCGRIGIAVRHFGIAEEPSSDYDSILVTGHNQRPFNRRSESSSDIISLSSNLNTSRSVQPARIVDRHAILGDKLAEYGWHRSAVQDHHHDSKVRSAHADQRAKLRSLKPIIRPTMTPLSAVKMERGLTLIGEFRSQMKQEGIQRLIHHHNRKIRARFGEAVLIRSRLINPYRQSTRFCLRIRNDPDEPRLGGLRLICSETELRHCQSMFSDLHSNDRDADRLGRIALFDQTDNNNIVLELAAEESILLCFCFQSWDASYPPEPYSESDRISRCHLKMLITSAILERRHLLSSEIFVENATNHNYVAGLKLQIDQAPFVTDATFRFYHFNNEILKGTLPLSKAFGYRDHILPIGNRSENFNGIAKIRCTNDSVAFEFNKSDDGGMGVLNFRYACGQYPELDCFYLLLFEDEHCLSLRFIWKVVVYARARINVNAVVGASQLVQACLPAVSLREHDLVVGFSSDPSLLTLEHGDAPFQLVSNALNQIGLLVRPNIGHSDGAHVLVNLMDARGYSIVYSWLVEIHITFPSISTSFDVALSLGSSTKKKIRYRNGYNEDRVFRFESSNPKYLQVLTETVNIAANEEGTLVLYFPAQSSVKSEVVYVFINDVQDQNEECLSFSLSYGVRRPTTETKRVSI